MDLSPKPAPAATAHAKAAKADNTLPIAAGGALALLALGGGAFALSRRRREHEEEEWSYEEPVPVESADAVNSDAAISEVAGPTATSSAFAWDNAHRAPATQAEEDDRMTGETWVQRAYRGPSANNPSVSLKTRLRRAAFFDKRERDVAAGVAEPVEMDAGLPEAMSNEPEHELA